MWVFINYGDEGVEEQYEDEDNFVFRKLEFSFIEIVDGDDVDSIIFI